MNRLSSKIMCALPERVISKYNCHGVWSAVYIMQTVRNFISFSLYGISQIMYLYNSGERQVLERSLKGERQRVLNDF
jgi:hypothetical protein